LTPLKIKDSWGKTREVTFVCYGMANAFPNVIINMPGLTKA